MTSKDFANIDRHIDHHLTKIREHQLQISSSTDMSAFVELRGQFSGYVHDAYNPEKSVWPSGGAFWLAASDTDGTTVACVATRRWDNAHLRELLLGRQIWYRAGPILDRLPPFPFKDKIPDLSGRIAMHGGLYCREDQRGRKLGINLLLGIRWLSLRWWGQDYNIGLISDSLKAASIQKTLYRYTNTATVFEGGRPSWSGCGTHDTEHLNWISKDDMLRQASGVVPDLASYGSAVMMNDGFAQQREHA